MNPPPAPKDQPTVPVSVRRNPPPAPKPTLPPAAYPPRPPQPPVGSARPKRPPTPLWARGVRLGRWNLPYWALGVLGVLGVIGLTLALFLLIGVAALGSDQILPAVSVAGVRVGGLTEAQAAAALQSRWEVMRLTDSGTGQSWQVPTIELGLRLDAAASAAQAYRIGRGDGAFFAGLLGITIEPVGVFDGDAARAGLGRFVELVSTPARNAGIALSAGQVTATEAQDGRVMDLDGTLSVLAQDPLGWLGEGRLPLRMNTIAPSVTDASQVVATAQALLAQPLTLRLFDPFSGNLTDISAPPEAWAGWLVAEPDVNDPLGVRLRLDGAPLAAFIAQADAQAGDYRYLKADEAAAQLQEAVRALRPTVQVRVYHEDRPRVVQAGETIIGIAYDEGVPYPWVQRWNDNISSISVGQTLVIPSVDNFLQYEPVANKRIIVSISQQRVWVYENGALKWEWVASTGVNDSPTWPGVYQIISRYPNAYAGNWNLYMPWFLGIYQPIPGADFTNGFHGYPTRGGGQILWRNSLGTKVTFGCVMLDDANARALYEWAENGVIVEIQA